MLTAERVKRLTNIVSVSVSLSAHDFSLEVLSPIDRGPYSRSRLRRSSRATFKKVWVALAYENLLILQGLCSKEFSFAWIFFTDDHWVEGTHEVVNYDLRW
jgi:hypothetical protein